jgi:NTE family protein
VSGTSAGSIVGAIVAAASMGDQLGPEEVKELALQLDYHKFTDPGTVERLPVLGPSLAVLRGTGIYKGDYAHDWVRSQLKNLGVRTFGDLAIDDDSLPAEQRYKLVVTVADVTTGQLVRLPWDYRRVYGLDPDEQFVADAVRASMSIPFYFRPVTLTSSTGLTSTLVDGGILSNFPIDSLDRTDRRPPRWPSFGVTVLPNLPEGNDKVIPALAPIRLLGPPHLLESVITTVLVGRDQAYLSQPWVSARTIRVDSTDVGFLDFGISDNEIEALYVKGYAAAQKFLSSWDWDAYLKRFR